MLQDAIKSRFPIELDSGRLADMLQNIAVRIVDKFLKQNLIFYEYSFRAHGLFISFFFLDRPLSTLLWEDILCVCSCSLLWFGMQIACNNVGCVGWGVCACVCGLKRSWVAVFSVCVRASCFCAIFGYSLKWIWLVANGQSATWGMGLGQGWTAHTRKWG